MVVPLNRITQLNERWTELEQGVQALQNKLAVLIGQAEAAEKSSQAASERNTALEQQENALEVHLALIWDTIHQALQKSNTVLSATERYLQYQKKVIDQTEKVYDLSIGQLAVHQVKAAAILDDCAKRHVAIVDEEARLAVKSRDLDIYQERLKKQFDALGKGDRIIV